jgi:peptidoglycan/LPS O-acetylase OafA/YrhL
LRLPGREARDFFSCNISRSASSDSVESIPNIFLKARSALRSVVVDLFARNDGEIEALNGLRALAILAVLLLHLYVPAGPYLGVPFASLDRFARNLTSGVDLFFVLSGFLVYSHLVAKPMNRHALLAYARKRARRILPAYIFALIGAAIYVYNLIGSLERAGQHEMAYRLTTSLSSVWTDLLFVSNYSADRLLEPGWSLSVEVHFYLLLPLLVLAFQRLQSRARLALLVVLFMIPTLLRLYWHDDGMIYFYTHTRLDGIFAGMIVAELIQVDSSRLLKGGLSIVVAALLLFGHLCEIDGFFYRTFRYAFFAAGFAMLLYLAVKSSKSSLFGRLLSSTALRFIARISYTLYLWHPIFLTVGLRQIGVNPDSEITHVFLGWMYALVVAAAGSTVLYLAIERPFQMRRASSANGT